MTFVHYLADQPWDHLGLILLAILGVALVVLSLTARSQK